MAVDVGHRGGPDAHEPQRLLAAGREAAAQGDWAGALAALAQADGLAALGPDDLARLATAAQLCGQVEVGRHARLRSYQIYLGRSDRANAVRAAVELGLGSLDTADVVRGSGCLPATLSGCSAWGRQAARLLEGRPESAEAGLALVPEAFGLLVTGEIADAERTAATALAIGRRFDDPDVVCLAGMIRARTLARLRRHAQAMALLDEVVDLAATGSTSATHAGTVLASAGQVAAETLDMPRLDHYTSAFEAWCAHQSGMTSFVPRLRLQQAQSARAHGRWDAALTHALDAASNRPADQDAAAAGWYEAGELYRLRGDRSAAEDAYGMSAQLGHDPQPGLALLRHAQGCTAQAAASVERALTEATTDAQRAALLGAAVEVGGGTRGPGETLDAVDELDDLARDMDSPVVAASALLARSTSMLARDEAVAALRPLRESCRIWSSLRMPYEEGLARALLSRACREMGDVDGARLEGESAAQIFRRLAASPDLDRLERMTDDESGTSSRLTDREIEVLRQLARGSTNKQIAANLVLSVRTVETHVGNVLAKLGVPNRSSAVARARADHIL